MAKAGRKTGRRGAQGSPRKPSASKAKKPGSRKPGSTKSRVKAASRTKTAPGKPKASRGSNSERLKIQLETARLQQQASAEILRVISQSPTDAQPVFDAIAQTAIRLLGCNRAFIQRCDDTHFWTVSWWGAEGKLPLVNTPRVGIDPAANFPSRAIVQKKTVHLPDWSLLELPPFERVVQDRLGLQTALFMPLLRDDTCIGLLSVAGTRANLFGEKEIALAESFRDQALIAIENVRLFDEAQAKTRDLTEALTYQTGSANILNVIASSPTDVAPVLKAIVENACELCEADDAIVYLRDGQYLRFSAHHGPLEFNVEKWPIDRASAAGRAFVDREPVHIHDVLSKEGEQVPAGQLAARRIGVRTMLSVPLLRKGESIGTIVLRRSQVHPFSGKQVALLRTFADQAVIAFGNVRLFEEVQAKTRELEQSLEDLRTAQDRLVQTEKLASLGQLTAGIAHEIKNPLNFVNNFSALSLDLADELNDILARAELAKPLRKDIDELTELLKDNLSKIVRHGKRADSIVKNMLLHSREGSGEHRPADINALVDESLNLAYHGARAENSEFEVTLHRDFDPVAGLVEVFPQEITRVLLNLISNGFYAVSKRKAAASGVADFEPLVTATTRAQGDHVEIRIRDNGTGIPPEAREKIFNPFFTTKPAGEGTGLGLSMSHDIIVKQHGGSIEVETEPGAFTEFIVTLRRNSAAQKLPGETR